MKIELKNDYVKFRREEETLIRQIQDLKEDCPLPLTHFVEYYSKLKFITQ